MLLGIDVGYSVIKAALYDEEGKEVALSRERVGILNPKPGFYEASMSELWIKTRRVIRDLARRVDPSAIKAIGFSGGGAGLYSLDERLKPVGNIVTPMDMRAKDILDEWTRTGVHDKIFKKIGQNLMTGSALPALKWFKENERGKYDRIKHLLSRKDFVRFKLTDELATEISDTCYGFTNVETQSYDKEVFEILGLDEMFDALPELKENSYDVAGYVTEEAERETGLKEGTPVAAGAHDACCNTMGVGAIKNNMVCAGGGTWSINLLVVDKPMLNKNWCCEHFVEKGKWMLEGASPTSTINLEWFIRNFGEAQMEEATKKGKSVYEICEKEIKEVDTDVIFLPFLSGFPWRYPYQLNASAGFLGLREDDGKMEMLRALYEEVAFMHAVHIEEFDRKVGVSEVRFTGGAAKSEVWGQMLADVLKKKVAIVDKEETGCFGAALLAALAVGEIKNLEETESLVHVVKDYYPKGDYGKKYETFKKICNSFGETWNRLEALRY